MNKLANILKNTVGGTYKSLNDIIAEHPDGVTITGVALREGKDEENIPSFTFAEEEGKYFYAVSGDLSKIYEAWLAEYGSVKDLDAALSKDYIKISITKVNTKNKKTYVRVQYLGTITADEYNRANAEAESESAEADAKADDDEDTEDVEVPF